MRTELVLRAAFAVGLTTSACGSGGANQIARRAELPAEIGPVPPDMQSDYESFASNCSKCHGLERALTAPVTENRHWDIYVAKMMRTAGSAINAKEAPHILRFLYWFTDRKKQGGGQAQAEVVDQTMAEKPTVTRPEAAPVAPVTQEVSSPAEPPAPASTGDTQGESAP